MSVNSKSKLLKKIFLFSFFCIISFVSVAQNNKIQDSSLLNNHLGNNSFINLPANNDIQKETTLPQDFFSLNKEWWINILFIFAFSILAFFILKFFNEISLLTKAFINKAILRQILTQKNSIYNNLFSFFNISTFILLSIFIFTYFSKVKTPFENTTVFIQILTIFSFIIFYYVILFSFSNIWAFMFNKKEISKLYLTNIKISNIIIFVILLFSLFVIFFNSNCNINCYKLIFFILLTIYSLRTFNLFRDFFENGFSLFYLILYLCTVEILPGFIIYKTFIN